MDCVFSAAFILALALSADAFAVSLARGVAERDPPHRTAIALGLACGAAQGVMPLVGWGLASLLSEGFAAYDHWVAFTVLAIVGARTIHAGLTPGTAFQSPPLDAATLLALALATSIDAAGAGLAFEAMGLEPLFAASVIAIVTAIVCAGGVYAGHAVGARLGAVAEVLGGGVLIAIGAKILWDHGALTLPG